MGDTISAPITLAAQTITAPLSTGPTPKLRVDTAVSCIATNAIGHIVSTTNDNINITLQDPLLRLGELQVTQTGTGVISLIGTVNGVTDMQITQQWTSLRLLPIAGGYVIA